MFDWLRKRTAKQEEAMGPEGDPKYELLNASPGTDYPTLAGAALALQQVAWNFEPDELADLLDTDRAVLSWRALLRLQRLTCLERLQSEDGQAHLKQQYAPRPESQETDADRRSLELSLRLLADTSPFKPQQAKIWQGKPGQPRQGRPGLVGACQNASLTHLGSLEVIRLDESQRPVTLDFVPFAEIARIVFGPSSLFRKAWIRYRDHSEEIVWAPMLYELSSQSESEYIRDGRMTSFCCSVATTPMRPGIGLGQQDLMLSLGSRSGMSMFGMGSVSEMEMIGDPNAPQKRSDTQDPEREVSFRDALREDERRELKEDPARDGESLGPSSPGNPTYAVMGAPPPS